MIEGLIHLEDRRAVTIKRACTQFSYNDKYNRRANPDARLFEKRFQELLLTSRALPSSSNQGDVANERCECQQLRAL